jgi:hypothetical protein
MSEEIYKAARAARDAEGVAKAAYERFAARAAASGARLSEQRSAAAAAHNMGRAARSPIGGHTAQWSHEAQLVRNRRRGWRVAPRPGKLEPNGMKKVTADRMVAQQRNDLTMRARPATSFEYPMPKRFLR